MSKWIRKGDTVVVKRGNDRGRTGKVFLRKGDRVWVEGVHVANKCVAASSGRPGKMVLVETPIHVSNVQICTDAEREKNGIRLRVRKSEKSGEKELCDFAGNLYRTAKRHSDLLKEKILQVEDQRKKGKKKEAVQMSKKSGSAENKDKDMLRGVHSKSFHDHSKDHTHQRGGQRGK